MRFGKEKCILEILWLVRRNKIFQRKLRGNFNETNSKKYKKETYPPKIFEYHFPKEKHIYPCEF